MSTAFSTAVNGLRMHQQTIDAIANNIANTNTVAFKSGVVHLSDSFYQTLRASTTGQPVGVQIGSGGQIAAIAQNQTQGSFQRTGGPTDIAIGGDGYFVMAQKDSTGVTVGTYFTRAGDFTLNSTGHLVNFEGLRVQGVLGDKSSQSGDAIDPSVNPPAAVGDIVIPTTFVSQADPTTATGTIVMGEDFPENTDTVVFTTSSGSTVTLTWGTDMINVNSASGNATALAAAINANATLAGSAGITVLAGGVSSSVITISANTSGSAGNAIVVSATGTGAANMSSTEILIRTGTLSGGADLGPLREEGVNSFTVGDDGAVNLFGSFGTVRRIAYVVLTKFSDPSALSRIGSNLYAFSTGAGTFSGTNSFSLTADTRKANTNGLGSLQNNALELSNVDLSQQFTDMITTQRAFEANARVITTGDEMLQTVVNLRR